MALCKGLGLPGQKQRSSVADSLRKGLGSYENTQRA